MSATFNHTLELMLDVCGETMKIDADVEYTCTRGTPATGPSYYSGGEPGDPAELEVHSVELIVTDKTAQPPAVIREPAPEWLVNYIANSDEVYQVLGNACGWGENDGPDPDVEYERMRDERAAT